MLSTGTGTYKCVKYSLLLINLNLPGTVNDRKGDITKTEFLLHVEGIKFGAYD